MDHPLCSVIVPTYNRPDQVSVCLQALAAQTYPKASTEVIIVDDGSAVPPGEVLQTRDWEMDTRLVTQPNSGPASARNRGAKEANGSILVFTDDDCIPDRDWLAALVQAMAENPQSLLGGRTVNHLEDNVYASVHQAFMDYLHNYYNSNPKQARFFPSNNLACSADTFHAVGGFDVSYRMAASEDRALCESWLKSGRRLRYVENALVRHAHPLSAWRFCRQHFNYGRGAYRYRTQDVNAADAGMETESGSFYMGLVLMPFKLKALTMRRRLLLAGLMGLTQAANTAGFFKEMTRTMRYKDQ